MADHSHRGSRVLYVTYDGLTDPLGQAQVVPYVRGLAMRGYELHLVSFEKADRFSSEGQRLRRLVDGGGLHWHPQAFTAGPRLLSKARDAWRMRSTMRSLHGRYGFDLIHCRSYPAADAALGLHGRTGVPFLFDMRGFWVDERVEGGVWPKRPPYGLLYRWFKRRELRYIQDAAAIVSLTRAGVVEMTSWKGVGEIDVEVIPCAVDLERFRSSGDPRARARTRAELGVPMDALVLGYLGSVGTWYLLEDMLRFFRHVLDRREAHFVLVTRDEPEWIRGLATGYGVPADRLVVVAAERPDVPRYIETFDASVYFIHPTYSKTGSSPTKMGELMAMGIPAITNAGVGDVEEVFAEHGAGLVVPDLTDASLGAAADRLDEVIALPVGPMQRGARELFDLEKAVARYATIYERVLAGRRVGRAGSAGPAEALP